MGFRFQRRIKILPGVRLNVSKTGVSWTVGTRGASVTARDGKVTGNVGLPGSGLSYRTRLDTDAAEQTTHEQNVKSVGSGFPIVLVLIVFAIGIAIGLSLR